MRTQISVEVKSAITPALKQTNALSVFGSPEGFANSLAK